LSILEPSQAETQEAAAGRISPSISNYDDVNQELSILTDDKRAGLLMIRPDVKVEILTPGWNKVLEKIAPRGELLIFQTKDLSDGIYELRCTSSDLEGKPVRAYIMWYKGNPVDTAKKILASAVALPITDTDNRKNLLAQILTDRLGTDLTKVKSDAWPSVYNSFMEYEELIMDEGGKFGSERSSGFVRLAYIDQTDGSPQFCRAYLPADYDKKKKYPMVVLLHGRSDEFPTYIKWGGVDQRHDGLADKYNCIVICPHARGNTWYRGIGDNDVTQCIDMAINNLPVDESRIYLKGYSMGGAGVWYYGSRHPEKFAAIVPFFGGYDFRFQMSDDAISELTPKSQFRRERLSYIGQIEALNNTPVFASHGDADTTVPVDYSRYTVKLMQSWGYNIRYWEHPGEGHGGLNEDQVNKWIFEQKKVADPKKVRIRSASLRYAQAQWVTINQRKEPYGFIRAEVDVISPNYIKVLTENALQLTLAPPASIVQVTKLIKVVWNDVVLIVMPENGKIILSEKDYKPVGIIKTSDTEGPANDIFCTPFAVVVGTQSNDPLMNAAISASAKRFAIWWDERFHTPIRIFKDTEIDDFSKSDYSLILLGWIGENMLAKEMQSKVPLTVSDSLITIDAGKIRIHDAGVQMIYPNPFNPYRYVLVRAGSSPLGMAMTDFAMNDTDFSIVDSRNMDISKNGSFFDIINGRNNGKIITCGYFDNNWKYQEKNTEKDNQYVLSPLINWNFPKYAVIQQKVEFYLSELMEKSADGAGNEILRDSSFKSDKLIVGKNKYDKGISFPGKYWLPKRPAFIEYNIADGGYNRLRAVIGLDVAKTTGSSPAAEKVLFEVEGDGIILYTSELFGRESGAKNINVDITGVKSLKLKVKYGSMPAVNIRAINWADVKLTK
jgi:poly(3-hydroxybutyrate) depolymerase